MSLPTGIATGNRRRNELMDIPDTRIKGPDQESEIPLLLAKRFMIHLANDDADKIGELIWWERLFERSDGKNNRDEDQLYVNLDEGRQENLREKYLIMAVDPDYSELIREHILDELMMDDISQLWNTNTVEPDYGNISIVVKDDVDRKLLEILIKSELLPGFDPVKDAQNEAAWKIVEVLHQQFGKLEDGKRKYSRRKDFSEEIYKKPKRKKKSRGTGGPPEADPNPVGVVRRDERRDADEDRGGSSRVTSTPVTSEPPIERATS